MARTKEGRDIGERFNEKDPRGTDRTIQVEVRKEGKKKSNQNLFLAFNQMALPEIRFG
jgi:hypothetical protein